MHVAVDPMQLTFQFMMVDLTEEVISRSQIVRTLFKLMIRVARGDHIVAAGED